MADNPGDKTPDAIKAHKPQQTYEMRGPDGAAVRQNIAELRVAKDYDRFNAERATKHVAAEREKIASQQDMEKGTKGLLSKEMNKERER